MPPVSLLIKPASSLCNMNCKYCFYCDVANQRKVKSYGLMDLDLLEIIVQKTLLYADKTCNFAFQGGEPTLVGIEFYKKLLVFQKMYNVKNVVINNVIQTNGYIINSEWAEFFAKNNFLVGLSLDGVKEIHDSMRVDNNKKPTFDKVMSAMALFKKYDVQYNILCVVNQFTARHVNKLWEFFKKNDVKYLQFIPCLDDFSGERNDYSLSAKRYGDFLKSTFDFYYNDFIVGNYTSVRNFDDYVTLICKNIPSSCGMSGRCDCYFVIEGDGSVFPCDFYVIDNYNIGNIATDTFEQMLNHASAKKFIDESIYIDEKCKQCKWLKLCRGGCRRYREPFKNGKPILNIHCAAYESFFEYSYKRLLELGQRL